MRWRGCRTRPPRRRRGDVARHRPGETEECLTGRGDEVDYGRALSFCAYSMTLPSRLAMCSVRSCYGRSPGPVSSSTRAVPQRGTGAWCSRVWRRPFS